jgi:acyl carrier protein
MVPAGYVLLDELPLSANGKVDHNALPAPTRLQGQYRPPQNEWERNIAAIWREVLHLEKVSVTDNFFDLGGHSLLLVQIHTKLRAIAECPLSMVDLFNHPTIRDQAELLSKAPKPQPTDPDEDQKAARRRQAGKRQAALMRERLKGL